MKKNLFLVSIALSLFVLQPVCAQDEPLPSADPPSETVGRASEAGKTSAATIAWAAVGIGFIVVIGIVIAISLSQNNKTQVIIVQH